MTAKLNALIEQLVIDAPELKNSPAYQIYAAAEDKRKPFIYFFKALPKTQINNIDELLNKHAGLFCEAALELNDSFDDPDREIGKSAEELKRELTA